MKYFSYAIIFKICKLMDQKGYTTESGGRQNGFALEPEINVISEGESKKSIILFVLIIISLGIGAFYFLM
tara:strand:- start:1417 stop:1626 length:210 start_codon:yes stop_codon:yes gene_type:complete